MTPYAGPNVPTRRIGDMPLRQLEIRSKPDSARPAAGNGVHIFARQQVNQIFYHGLIELLASILDDSHSSDGGRARGLSRARFGKRQKNETTDLGARQAIRPAK
jgi:hypothetical protein